MSLPTLQTLKTTAAEVFTRTDYQNVRWAGIFGSFVRGEANEFSDVDVVVIEAPYDWSVTKRLLEEVLPTKWSRPVDVIHIKEGQTELRGYIQLESLLASLTIFLRDDAARDEVARLRTFCKDSVEKGYALYSAVASRTDEVRHLVDDTSLEGFRSWPSDKQAEILSQVSSILNDLNIQPRHLPMHEAFWYAVIKDAGTLRKRLEKVREEDAEAVQDVEEDKTTLGETTLRTAWDVLTTQDKGLEFLARMTRKFVLPQLDETRVLGKEAEDICKVSS